MRARSAYAFFAAPMALALSAAAPANAAPEGHGSMRTIVVSGLGEASAAPDMAYLSIGVEAEGATAAEALRKNSEKMEATLKSLRDGGVDKKDIQTSGLSVGAKYDYSRENQPPRIIGYQATNTVQVKLRNIDKAGAIIDRAVGVGANRLDSISFGFSNPKPLLNDARRAAVADARERAGLYAEAAGVKLGPVIQISDSFSMPPGPVPVMARAEAMDMKAVPIAAGESTLSANVTVIYGIE